jgi:hypothetical protein
MGQHLYAGWIVLDLRLLVFVLLISLFLTVSIITLFVRGRRWHEYVTIFVAVYTLAFAVILVVFNVIARYPVFRVEALFPFP